MIKYNPKEWFTFIFKLHKGDTIRALFPMLVAIAIYTGLVVFIEKEVLKLPDSSHIKNIPLMHALLGGVISLLLVFRTNSAYDRWWEGRKLWGELTNNSRNLALKLSVLLAVEDYKEREYFRKIIPAFAFALKNHLLSNKADWELFDEIITPNIANNLNRRTHIPIQVAQLIYKRIHGLHVLKKINDADFIMFNDEIKSFMNICGACERIKNTPIPFSYSVYLKKIIFGYIMTLPFGYVFGLGYLAIPVITFVFYVLASLELIAEEIEDPFGGDENDLPMLTMSKNIHKVVDDIFVLKNNTATI